MATDTLRGVRTLLVAPSRFFGDYPPADTLRGAFAVVVLLAVASTAGVASVGLLLAGAVGAPTRVWDPVLGRLPYVFGGVFLGWLVVAGGLHAATAIFDGEGSFRATFAVAGCALLNRGTASG